MRIQLIIIFLTCGLLHVCANGNAQSVTIDFKNADVVQVFNAIEKQTGYSFMYNLANVTGDNKVTVSITLRNVPIKDALDACVKGTPLAYKIINDAVVISRKPETINTAPVRQNITGKVTDQKTGNPLPGVTVRVKGTDKGTVTDGSGNYVIDAEPDGVLVFTFVGYRTFEIKINKQATIDMTMVENEATLSETVVKGYYTTTKELNTGNVSTVKAEQIARQPVSDPMAALIGKVPGLFIQQTSGIAGRRFNVRIRGQNSLDNGSEPLYIVDGVQYSSIPIIGTQIVDGGTASPFNFLNPSDIERIEVLKDADATSIYGSRGSNGVVLIFTKKGNAGRTQIDINTYAGIGNSVQRVKFMTTSEYLAMRRQAILNDNRSIAASDNDLNGKWDTTRYTDWQQKLLGNSAPVAEASISLSGGSENTRFRIGSTYRTEKTIYSTDYSAKKIAISFNLDHNSTNKKLKTNLSAIYVDGANDLPYMGLSQYVTLAPDAPELRNQDGSLNWQNSTWDNPYAFFERKALEKVSNLISNLSLSYDIAKDLVLKSSFGYNSTDFNETYLQPATAFNPMSSTAPALNRYHRYLARKVTTWLAEPQLSYKLSSAIGTFDALIGVTLQGTNSNNLEMSAIGFVSDGILKNLAAGSTFPTPQKGNSEYRYSAIYTHLGYNYEDRYLLNITARRDGSSRYGPGSRFGNFGALGVAWIFSKEKFMKNLEWISLAKLRASYGTTGNDQIGDYNYLDTYSVYAVQYQSNPSFNPTQLTNPFYGWERVNKLELATELAFLDNKLSLNLSAYRNRTKNQLVQYSLPSVTGFASIRANLPAVIQNSGLEIEIASANISTKTFSWSSSVNLTIPKNKLVSFPNIQASSYASKYVVGMPISRLAFVYQYKGLDPTTGYYSFKDVNGDKNLSFVDQIPVFIGQKFYGAIENNLTFNGLELDFSFQFTKQNGQGYFINGIPGLINANRGNQPVYENQQQYMQKYTTSNTNGIVGAINFAQSDKIITDASFIRLKNVSLSYQLPIRNKLKNVVSRASVYAQGQNLLTISKYQGFEPESPSTGWLVPSLRTLAFGIKVSL